MDAATKSVVFAGSVPFDVGARQYRVRPLSMQDIVSNEFAESGLYCPAEDEPPDLEQLYRLQDERYRQQLDKWLRRLVTYEGRPLCLEDTVAHRWPVADIGRLLTEVVGISGLSRADREPDAKPTEPEDWLAATTELQRRAHMGWDEIMSMPLLRLNAVRKEAMKQTAQDLANSMGGLLVGATGAGAAAKHDGQPSRRVEPLLGKTPEFSSREEYFAWMNRHT